MMSLRGKLMAVICALMAALLLVPAAWAQEVTPSVSVSDQEIEDETVTIDSVVSEGAGWIVIHIEEDGAPGAVIGRAAVSDGENEDVEVEIDVEMATETLYAMLHADTGEEGTYEFPDADPPVEVDGNVVVQAFTITGGLPAAEAEEEATATPTAEEEEAVLPETGAEGTAGIVLALVVVGVMALTAGILLNRLATVRRGPGRDN